MWAGGSECLPAGALGVGCLQGCERRPQLLQLQEQQQQAGRNASSRFGPPRPLLPLRTSSCSPSPIIFGECRHGTRADHATAKPPEEDEHAEAGSCADSIEDSECRRKPHQGRDGFHSVMPEAVPLGALREIASERGSMATEEPHIEDDLEPPTAKPLLDVRKTLLEESSAADAKKEEVPPVSAEAEAADKSEEEEEADGHATPPDACGEPAPERDPELEDRSGYKDEGDAPHRSCSREKVSGEHDDLHKAKCKDAASDKAALFGADDEEEEAEAVVPNVWERFLGGDIVFGACGCITWLIIIFAISACSFPAMKFSDGRESFAVLSDILVQEIYVYEYVIEEDNVFLGGDGGRRLRAHSRVSGAEASAMPESLHRRLATSLSADRFRASSGDIATIIYEAVGTECPGDDCDLDSKNLLQPQYIQAIRDFETALWKHAPFQEKFCQFIYPVDGLQTEPDPMCSPPLSFLQQLYFGSIDSPEMTEYLLLQGFGRPEMTCVCSVASSKCGTCTSEPDKAACAEDSMVYFSTDMQSFNMSYEIVNSTCEFLLEGDQTCGYSPPLTSSPCSSSAWSYIDHGDSEILKDDSYHNLLTKLCSEDPGFTLWRDLTMPIFACDGAADASTVETVGVPFMRSFIFLGAPVSPGETPRYWDDETELDYLSDNYGDQFLDLIRDAGDRLKSSTGGKVRANVIAGCTIANEILALLAHDASMGFISFILVFLYMWFTVESCFLACMGVLQVLLSFPPAAAVWYLINPDGLTSSQILSLFLILGIGADDVFVLVDAWKQTRLEYGTVDETNRTEVFACAYRRAFSAMAATTFTTALSFLFGMFSKVDFVKNFCIFASIVVVCDFLWCITFLAASIAVYDRYIQGRLWPLGPPAKPGQPCQQGCLFGIPRLLWRLATRTPADATTDQRMLERVISGPGFSVMSRCHMPLLAFWFFIILCSIVSAVLGLEIASDPPEFADDEAAGFVREITLGNNYFSLPEGSTVAVYWGVDDEPVEYWRSRSPPEPKPRWRSNFAEAITTEAGQQKVLNLCKAADQEDVGCGSDLCLVKATPGECARNEAIWQEHRINIPADPLCRTGRYCFMEQVEEYATYHSDVGFPIPQAMFVETISSEGFTSYSELRKSLLEESRHWDAEQEHERTGWLLTADNRFGFAHITFNATYRRRLAINAANKLYDHWESFVDQYAGGTNPKQVASIYGFMVLQNELLSAAIIGICIALGVALICLVLVTFNWWLSLIGFLTISSILAVFVGVIPLLGWQIGMYECIFLILTVGLSVDYTLHLLHAYHESSLPTRAERTRESMSAMGITVLSGAATTLLASLPLFWCHLNLLRLYGVFIFFVILVSIVIAITLLPPVLMQAGPQGSFGEIRFFYAAVERLKALRHLCGH